MASKYEPQVNSALAGTLPMLSKVGSEAFTKGGVTVLSAACVLALRSAAGFEGSVFVVAVLLFSTGASSGSVPALSTSRLEAAAEALPGAGAAVIMVTGLVTTAGTGLSLAKGLAPTAGAGLWLPFNAPRTVPASVGVSLCISGWGSLCVVFGAALCISFGILGQLLYPFNGADNISQAHAKLFIDNHSFTTGHQFPVHIHFQGFPGQLVQFHH